MKAVTGIFTSFEQARRSAEELSAQGFSNDHLNLLAPGSSAADIEDIPSTEGEQPGMGKAVGGVVGAALGTAGGRTFRDDARRSGSSRCRSGYRDRSGSVGATRSRRSYRWWRRRWKFGERAHRRTA